VIVVGSDAADMQKAQNRVVKEQGGYVVCTHGKITADAPLHIAGIISEEPMEKLGRQIAEVRSQMEALGWHNANVIMNLSTLALPVSPAVKMTDYGYLDVRTQKTLPLIVREE
jgi:adenine deaminase